MSLENKLQRVEIAGELLASASLTKTKRAAKNLGDETLSLLSSFVDEFNEYKSELDFLKTEILKIKAELQTID